MNTILTTALLSFDFSFHPIGKENVFYRALLKCIPYLRGLKIKDKASQDKGTSDQTEIHTKRPLH